MPDSETIRTPRSRTAVISLVVAVLALVAAAGGIYVTHGDATDAKNIAQQALNASQTANALASKADDLTAHVDEAQISLDQVPPVSDYHGTSQATYTVTMVLRNDGGAYALQVAAGAEPRVTGIDAGGRCPTVQENQTSMGTPTGLPLGQSTTRTYQVTLSSGLVPAGSDPVRAVVFFWRWTNADGSVKAACFDAATMHVGGDGLVLGLPASTFNKLAVRSGAIP